MASATTNRAMVIARPVYGFPRRAKIAFMLRRAFGAMIACAIVSACSRASSRPATFNKDVAPIVFANCASCHRPGGDGPFSLLTFAQAAQHATEIGEETVRGHMPPWLPEPGDVPIAGVRRLSAAQIDTI